MVSYYFRRCLLLLSLVTLLGGGCAPVPHSPITPPDGLKGSPTHRPSASSSIAEINRAVASAAMQAPASPADYRLGAEDLLQITVFNIAGVNGGVTPRDLTVRVSQQGNVTLPLLGKIQVAGLTTLDLEKLLGERYDEYIYNPQVGVLITEFRSFRVSVIGAVNRAGVFDLTGPKTLTDVLALAGGVNSRAGNRVHIYRQGPDGRESHLIDLFALASNIGLINERTAGVVSLSVQAGDIINVPEAGSFFVDGAVRGPGPFPLDRRYTVTQAIALAGGINKDLADYSGITIYRYRGNSEVEQIAINLSSIRAGTDPDLLIQADDIIFVPISGGKWAWGFWVNSILGFIPRPF